MFKKTIATVKHNRLSIFAKDAVTPSVNTMPLDQAMAGNFDLTSQNDGTIALSFKPSGKKTVEIIALYHDHAKAARALETVFSALGHGGKSGGFWGMVGGAAKIIGLIILGVILIIWIMTMIFGAMLGGDSPSDLAPPQEVPTLAEEAKPLPVGEPIRIEDFIEQTQGEGSTN